jgi:hypothetical protein
LQTYLKNNNLLLCLAKSKQQQQQQQQQQTAYKVLNGDIRNVVQNYRLALWTASTMPIVALYIMFCRKCNTNKHDTLELRVL